MWQMKTLLQKLFVVLVFFYFSRGAVFNPIDTYWTYLYLSEATTLKTFNKEISAWSIRQVDSTCGKLFNATLFNQPLESWDISEVTSISNMFNMQMPSISF